MDAQEIARTPEPPYYAVIFTSLQTGDQAGYDAASARMMELAAGMPGFLGVEAARERLGMTVSYWADLASIAAWKRHAEHVDPKPRAGGAGMRIMRPGLRWWSGTIRSSGARARAAAIEPFQAVLVTL